MRRIALLSLVLCLAPFAFSQNDEAYGKRIREVTTEKQFLTEIVDHLPASATVPSPLKYFGKIIGEPDLLHYSEEINGYMRALDAASDRVVVRSMGKSEEGREMIAVFISDAANLARLDEIKALNAKLSDPRQLANGYKGDGKLDGADDQAEQVMRQTVPIYYATGGMHSPESGPPEMLMELAYRLAVEDSPMIQNIRKNSIVMLTPVLDTDGRDRYVDTYFYRKRNPKKPPVPLVYWGKYVGHDNNRDNIGLELALSKNLLKTWLEYRPLVMHDLHQSIPFLYISTGTGPYNAWLDPITIDEWHILAYNEVDEMTKRGVPGVWTHGFYDGWAPNYAFYAANGHNAIGRFYEIFGGGADTRVEDVGGEDSKRDWYRPNPPYSKVRWSIRNNINISESALLMGMDKVARERDLFLKNYYLKTKRSVLKPWNEGPAAYVIEPDAEKPMLQRRLASLMDLQGVEVMTLGKDTDTADGKFKKGSLVIRMDQPYCRMADMLLDKQYYKATDPEPYDDTGWTLGSLFNLNVNRVKDAKILAAPMDKMGTLQFAEPAGKRGRYLLMPPSADAAVTMTAWRDASGIEVAEEPFKVGKTEYSAGTYVIPEPMVNSAPVAKILSAGLPSTWVDDKPNAKTHLLSKPRVVLVHDWMFTQNEGWVRLALDELQVPYQYKSVHELRDNSNLKGSYDVIILGPSFGKAAVVDGRPMVGDPIPWKPMEGLRHLGGPDQSDDIRGGAGLQGMMNLQRFLDAGGLLVCMGPVSQIPVDYGLVKGISLSPIRNAPAGGVFLTERGDKVSPVLYGYGDTLGTYTSGDYWSFRANVASGGGNRGGGGGFSSDRPSGRGDKQDPDVVQGRPPYELPKDDPDTGYKPPEQPRPKVLLRFAPADKVWVSGGYGSAEGLAGAPAVVLCPAGKGNVLLFGINPMWRGETVGSWQLVTNALANWDHLWIDEPKVEAKKDEKKK